MNCMCVNCIYANSHWAQWLRISLDDIIIFGTECVCIELYERCMKVGERSSVTCLRNLDDVVSNKSLLLYSGCLIVNKK